MIGQALAALSATRAQTLAILAPLSQTQLDFPPAAGRWSIGEVADHLVRAEELYRGELACLVELARAGRRPYLRRSFDELNVAPLHLPAGMLSLFEGPIGIMSRFIPDVVRRFVTEFPIVPTRNPDLATPRAGRSGAELRQGLRQSLAETRALVTSNADLDFARMISEHPLTGPSTGPQILEFLVLHERRHQAQMGRVKSDRRFPAA